MRVTIIADCDPAAQCATLWKAFNRFSKDIEARYIVCSSTYLEYDEDMKIGKTPKAEVHRVIQESDFFILVPVTTYPIMSLPLERNNYLVWLVGSLARLNQGAFLFDRLRNDTMFVTSMDYTTSAYIPSAQHLPISILLEEIPKLQVTEGKIRIAHAPTQRQIKSTEVFLEAMRRVHEKHPNVETVLIEGKPWKESLQLKSTCDICFDQMFGAYGMGAVESMAMGQVVLGRTNAWVKSFFTEEVPIIDCTPQTLEGEIERIIECEECRRVLGLRGMRFVHDHHDARKNIKKWINLLEFVRSR